MHAFVTALPHLGRVVKIGAVILLVGTALLANLMNLAALRGVHPSPNDVMAQRDLRFERLRDALPKRGTVGYLSDAATWTEQETRLLMAQFALAPLILVLGADQAFVVGEFADPASAAKARDQKLTVVLDTGDGLVLFARPRE